MAKRDKTDRSKATGLFRSGSVVREKIDPENRRVELAFSSEHPVERWGENEVLSHSPGDYDFSRFASADHPLLLGHDEWDPKTQIGVIESARVDSDKVGRAVVRFGKSPLADEIWNDLVDGIRKLVSVGYDRKGKVSSLKDDNGMMTSRYRWAPTHIAMVPVPADTKVGVGRAKSAREEIEFDEHADEMENSLYCVKCGAKHKAENLDAAMRCPDCRSKPVDTPQKPEAEKPANDKNMRMLLDPAPVDGGKIATDATTAERNRCAEIHLVSDTIIKDHPHLTEKVNGMRQDALSKGDDIKDFKIRVMTEAMGAKPAKPVLMADLGMNDDEQRSYSILRGIQRCLARDSKVPDGLEGEVHQEMMKHNRTGIDYGGFAVPANAPVRCRTTRGERRRMQRDLNVTTFGQGGAFVQTTITTPIIEILRNRMVCERLGVVVMAGLEGNVAIPRQTGAATAYALPESATLTKSTQVLDQVLLAPHRVGAQNDYTRQLLMQSSIDVENFIRDDLMKVIAVDWDRLILNGQGAQSEPLGIIQTPGVASLVFGGAASWSNVVLFETNVALANADVEECAYVTTPGTRGRWKVIAKTGVGVTSVVPIFLWENDGYSEGMPAGTVNGYRAVATNQIPGNLVVFGSFGDVIQGLYGGYDVIVNPYSRDTDAAVRVTINTFGDVAVRHPASFCVSADAGNQ